MRAEAFDSGLGTGCENWVWLAAVTPVSLGQTVSCAICLGQGTSEAEAPPTTLVPQEPVREEPRAQHAAAQTTLVETQTFQQNIV